MTVKKLDRSGLISCSTHWTADLPGRRGRVPAGAAQVLDPTDRKPRILAHLLVARVRRAAQSRQERRVLEQQERARRTPELHFISDDSIEKGARIISLIESLHKEEAPEEISGEGDGSEGGEPTDASEDEEG